MVEASGHSLVISWNFQYNSSFHKILTMIGFPGNTGERTENSVKLIGCLMEMTSMVVGGITESLGKEVWKFGESY